jgi:energy-coupling factor transport system ATP-binding protein
MIELKGIAAAGYALRGVDLDLAPGERLVLMGANGAGKSTLLHSIVALTSIDAGQVRVDGLDPFDAHQTVAVRQRVGFVQQRPDDQIVATSVEDDTAFGPENLGLSRPEMRLRVSEALAAVGLSGFESREPHTLSGGQKQRLVIAGALALRPRYLLLDEPTSMLDPQGKAEVLAILTDLTAAGCGILHVTHSLSEAASADRVCVLSEGRCVFCGPPADLKACSDEQLRDWGIARGLRTVTRAPYEGKPGGEQAATEQLRATRLSYCYDLGTEHIEALREIDLALAPGELVLVRGVTGSGKSTLLTLLAGLLKPDAGAVTLGAHPLTPQTARGQVGLIFQDPESQLFDETVLDDVAFGPRNLGCDKAVALTRARDALCQVGLGSEDFGKRSPFRLSGGQARRVAIAGIIALRPRFILADEPTSGLDAVGRDQVRALLASLTAHCGVLVVSHSPEEFSGCATRIYELSNNRLRELERNE